MTVILLADLSSATWHATWSNRFNFGIENRNAGRLQYRNGQFFWWANNWQARFPDKQLDKNPVRLGDNYWEPYTVNQVKANIVIGRMLHSLYATSGGLDPSWVIPHSSVQREKSDTGRAFPLTEVRSAIFSARSLDNLELPTKVVPLTEFTEDVRGDTEFVLVGDCYDPSSSSDMSRCFLPVDHPSYASSVPPGYDFRQVCGALSQLGYYVDAAHPECLKQLHVAAEQFQRCMGLRTDGIVGPNTLKAIGTRLADFGYPIPGAFA